MDVEQLRDIVVSCKGVLLSKGGTNTCRLLLDKGTLIGHGLYDGYEQTCWTEILC